VWVLTNGHEVTYILTESREAARIQEVLANFKGVLISDFYAAYDNVGRQRQRCLIHFIRELNDELLASPFDDEFKEIATSFGYLLQRIVTTVDGNGLKSHFLKKHLKDVDRFYRKLTAVRYQSELSVRHMKKFQRYRNELFTFLSHDGVSWHNNNAEHAIKAFVPFREALGGNSSTTSLDEYLTLLSVCQTCKLSGVDFLDFLCSGKKDINAFAESKGRRNRRKPQTS